MKEWLIHLSTLYKESEWWSIFWSLIWGIWLKRNTWIFEHKRRNLEEIISKAISVVGEYEKANENSRKMASLCASPSSWKAPAREWYKINSDAALLDGNKAGLGAVMRDYLGDVLVSICDQVEEVYEADVAEAMAARQALKIGLEAGLRRITLESDCLKPINHLGAKIVEATSFGSGNQVAHCLAKLSSSLGELRVWMEEVPLEATDLVNMDIASLND
ncbi:DNA mismatch repair protein MutS [Bienertia sinuspersici]